MVVKKNVENIVGREESKESEKMTSIEESILRGMGNCGGNYATKMRKIQER